jgi:hypothetical protein
MEPSTINEYPTFNPETIAEEDPYSYVFVHQLHKDPDFQNITDSMIENIIEKRPEIFFELKFHHEPEFSKWIITAAKSLIISNPLYYIFGFKLHKSPALRGLLPMLFESLCREEKCDSLADFKNKEPILFKTVLDIVEDLAKYHSKYFADRDLAKIKEACILHKLIKMANRMDQLNKFDLANQIDIIIGEYHAK